MNKIFINVIRACVPLTISLSLISCVGSNSTTSTNSTGSITTATTLGLTGTSNDLNLESSPDYAKYSMSNIPIGSFGLVGLQLKNIGNSTLSQIQITSPTKFPEEVTIDYTRTTCYVDINSATSAIKILAPNQACNVVLKFEPTKEEAGSIILNMSTQNLEQQPIVISSDTINYATRNDLPTPTPRPTLTPIPTPTPTLQPGAGKYAYIYGKKNSYCSVDSAGDLSNCGSLNISSASFVNVYQLHAYLIGGSRIQKCDIASDGNFFNCNMLDSSPSAQGANVQAIRFYNNHAYIVYSVYGNSQVDVCGVDQAGGISNCEATTQNILYSRDITFNGNYAYISGGDLIYSCAIVDEVGHLGSCQASAKIPGILFRSLNSYQGYIYTSNLYPGLFRFAVNPTDGRLERRELIGLIDSPGFSTSKVYGININNDNDNAYMVQPEYSGTGIAVLKCNLQDHSFANCKNELTTGDVFGIAFSQ